MTRENDVWNCEGCGKEQGRHDQYFKGNCGECHEEKLILEVMKKLKEAFINYRTRTNFDHSEWFDTDFGTIRLFSPMDYANGEYEEIEVEGENGNVFDLNELDNETIELLIDYLI